MSRLASASCANASIKERWADVEWASWLFDYLPNYFYSDFADHHVEFWEAVERVPPSGMGQLPPDPTFAVFALGHGKSTNLEAACVRLMALKKRWFILYVSGTQDQADGHLATIAQMLRSPPIAPKYPDWPTRASRKLPTAPSSRGSWGGGRLCSTRKAVLLF